MIPGKAVRRTGEAAGRCGWPRAGRTAALGCLALALLCLPGCFGGRFDEAQRQAATVDERLAGAWQGEWKSSESDDGGSLRCVATKLANDRYDVEFNAKFWKVFSHTQKVVLTVHEKTPVWRFRGEAELRGLGGGIYKYEGWTDGETFYSTYSASFDTGTFKMKRVRAKAGGKSASGEEKPLGEEGAMPP